MAFARPTLSDLVTQIQQDFVSRLDLSGPLLRRSVEYVLARVIAGATHMVYGFLAYIANQLFPQSADIFYLLLLGNLRNVPQEAATFARGTTTVTGTNGTVIPATTVLTRADGAQYTVDTSVTISGGSVTASLTAAVAGVVGNCDIGTVLTLSIAGADSNSIILGMSDGADPETTDAYRSRVVAAWQNPPQGGNETDYEAWARQVPGVTRVWVRPQGLGAGTVVIYVPSSGQVASVQAVLDSPDTAPVGAAVTVIATTNDATNFTIHLSPDTTATRTEITAELTDFFSNQTEPGKTGGSVSVLLSALRTVVGQSVQLSGGTDYVMTAPSADIVPSNGHLPVMGTITWT